jgi:hypothetical protein
MPRRFRAVRLVQGGPIPTRRVVGSDIRSARIEPDIRQISDTDRITDNGYPSHTDTDRISDNGYPRDSDTG